MRFTHFSAVLLHSLMAMAPLAGSEALVIAHRGASAVAPENTAASIREAIRLGAKVVEFDVRTTSDGVLVLFHDKDLDRLAGRPGSIEASDWESVRGLDVGAWFGDGSFAGEPILRFDEAVRICLEGGAIPLIEHKTGPAGAYAEVIRSLGAADRVIVQSFDWKFLRAFREEMPSVPIGALGSKALDETKLADLADFRPDWVGWSFMDFEAADLPRLRGIGAKVALWTVNDPEAAADYVAVGVDAIITDVPDEVAERLGKVGEVD
jgi:glycerophosphoryl diester phosphodiesterase